MIGVCCASLTLFIGLIGTAAAEAPAEYKTYDGYQLIQIIPKSVEQAKWITNIEDMLGEELDFWMETERLPAAGTASDSTNATADIRPTQLLLSAEQRPKVQAYLKKHDIESTVQIEDLGHMVRDDAIASLRPEGVSADVGPNFNLNEYHSHSEILNYLTFLAKEHNDFVKLGSIGQSFEGRNLTYLKIGYPSDKPKNAFFVDAGIHAREWITPATALHFINKLVTNETLRPLLHDIDIYVLPSLNPDGYEYSRRVDRFWRKSRTGPRGPRKCYGVDLNRNFEFYWGFSGVSHNPCSEVYCGPTELSENESRALTNFLRANNKTIKAYVSLHSYGNLLIHPWGHIEHSYPEDIEEVYKAGTDVANAIRAAGGPNFKVGSGPQILYPVAGSSDDFAKSLGIKYTYTMELTDTPLGFIFPAHLIQETTNYLIPGLLTFTNYVKSAP